MITLAHRIQLMPNNKQRTYFRKAIGCCRFAYNWGLAEWQRRYKEGEQGLTGRKLRNHFNAIRGEEFPWTYEVTKYATAHAFDDFRELSTISLPIVPNTLQRTKNEIVLAPFILVRDKRLSSPTPIKG